MACKFSKNGVKAKCFLIIILKSSALVVWSNSNVSAFITLSSRNEQIFGFEALHSNFGLVTQKRELSNTVW